MCRNIGYVRVSAKSQNEDRQMLAMYEVGIARKNIYIDKQSGKDFERPMYCEMLKGIRKNDVIYIKSIDRLGRNYEDVIEQWKFITKVKEADIVVLDMPLLDTRRGKDLMGTFLTDIVLALLSYISENEREMIRQRQAEGVAIAKARGVRFGISPKKLPKEFEGAYELWKQRKISTTEGARLCGMARTTFYERARQRLEAEKEFLSTIV